MNYNERHAAIVQYMQAKIAEKDWHGVSDAANDLREIEAEERVRIAQAQSIHIRNLLMAHKYL